MPAVLPFRAVRYDESVAGGLSDLISPPYDVVDRRLHETLCARSAHNVVRLILPGGAGDGERPGAQEKDYLHARRVFDAWLAEGALARDDRPGFYVLEQTYAVAGTPLTRTGLVALVKLEDFGEGIRPHERTLDGPKADRLNLLRATRANFGQIFSLFEDRDHAVAPELASAKRNPPLGEAVDTDGVLHRVWAVTDPAAVERIRAAMDGLGVLIADGHHRYETALNYMRENPGAPAARYRMMTLVDIADPGLLVLPTHRLVHDVPDVDPAAIADRLGDAFDVAPAPSDTVPELQRHLHALGDAGKHAFGVVTADGLQLATLRETAAMDTVGDRSEAWKRLDVAILHTLVLERALGITPQAIAAQENVSFIKDIGDAVPAAVARVREGEAQALFLLNPTRVDDVVAVAREGERMPQKSTFFHPKVFTGLVIRRLDDDDIPDDPDARKERP